MSREEYKQAGVAMTCRSYGEYLLMFDLKEDELQRGSVLDVAAGGSSFTAEARERGIEAFAADPRYSRQAEDWAAEAAEEIVTSTAKLVKLEHVFDWSYYGSPEKHKLGREASLKRFRIHAEEEVKAEIDGRLSCYRSGSLPHLPFEDNSFSLVLCSHFLFLYAGQFDREFHESAVLELLRVAAPGGEVRIYPLIGLNWEPYAELDSLLQAVERSGGQPIMKRSKLPFIPGSEHFLQIIKG